MTVPDQDEVSSDARARVADRPARPVRDGSYAICLSVDQYVGHGTLTMFQGDGQGHDGTFKIEVHVSGRANDIKGVINILLVMQVAREYHLPTHFSLAVSGSGDVDGFKLAGSGPGDAIVELSTKWTEARPGARSAER